MYIFPYPDFQNAAQFQAVLNFLPKNPSHLQETVCKVLHILVLSACIPSQALSLIELHRLPVYKLELQESREVRNLTEVILPVIAEEMKLSKDWSYKELYLSILEATAKICRIQKYKIYTLQELQDKVREKLLTLEGEELPAFVQIISKDRFL